MMNPKPAWDGHEKTWEAHGHVGPNPRRPASETELNDRIAWCRRCCRLLFALGKVTDRGHLPCTRALVGIRATPAFPPSHLAARPAPTEDPLVLAA